MKNYNFTIDYIQYLDSNGKLTKPLPESIENSELISIYKAINLTRAFDFKAINLQRQGLLGTFPSSLGQEAISVISGMLLEKNDIYVPNYRDHGALFQRNVSLEEVLLYWGGSETGSNYKNNPLDLPISVPIATQVLHAAGIAYGVKYKKENKVVLSSCGDGGTSKGDFYDAINAAGIWNLPMILIIHNNNWAISLPRKKQTAAQTLAQKALSGGIDSIQIDGNDIFAIYFAIKKAIANTRNEKGPFVIEAMTYRLADHTTADDSRRYISKKERENAWTKEPITRFKNYLINNKIISKESDKEIIENAKKIVEKASKKYLEIPNQNPESLIDYLYKSLPEPLIKHRNNIIKYSKDSS